MSIPGAQFVVDTEGKKTAVLLSVRQYEKLLEDLHDLAVIAARRDEAPMTFEDIKQCLQEDGLV
ncbi:MAG: type II toxin-antitoxin system Phd/YefM family antitoxin [Gammaproteobacteria bacterium]|nr:type II toxin-antitoxin system Phd/YefM family antitoxin [Gammaproteobacteria bacterium]